MLQVSKLFLLLITCVSLSLACTSSKRKSPTTPDAPIIDDSNQSNTSSKGKLSSDNTSQDEEEKPTEEEGGTPVLYLSLVELSKEKKQTIQGKTHTWQEGMYVTFRSNKDVMIETIEYDFNYTPDHQSEDVTQLFRTEMFVPTTKLSLYVMFTHEDDSNCVMATLDQSYLPKKNKSSSVEREMTNHQMKDGRCIP